MMSWDSRQVRVNFYMMSWDPRKVRAFFNDVMESKSKSKMILWDSREFMYVIKFTLDFLTRNCNSPVSTLNFYKKTVIHILFSDILIISSLILDYQCHFVMNFLNLHELFRFVLRKNAFETLFLIILWISRIPWHHLGIYSYLSEPHDII